MVGGGCGGRALRRVDSSPRPSLCRSDAMKKNKRSKRSRLSAALREFKMAAKARDTDGLLQLLVTGHRASRGGYEAAAAAGGTSTERSVVADTGAEQRARQGGGAVAAAKAGGPLLESGRPAAPAGVAAAIRGRRGASWVLAATLVLALACVVALGTAPAICCCTCAVWMCGGRAKPEHASDSKCGLRRGSCHGGARATVQPQVGNSTLYKVEVAGGRAV